MKTTILTWSLIMSSFFFVFAKSTDEKNKIQSQNDKSIGIDIKIYTDNVNKNIVLELTSMLRYEKEFILYDITNKKIMLHKLTPEQNMVNIDASGLTAGIYLYKLISGNEILKMDKIVIGR